MRRPAHRELVAALTQHESGGKPLVPFPPDLDGDAVAGTNDGTTAAAPDSYGAIAADMRRPAEGSRIQPAATRAPSTWVGMEGQVFVNSSLKMALAAAAAVVSSIACNPSAGATSSSAVAASPPAAVAPSSAVTPSTSPVVASSAAAASSSEAVASSPEPGSSLQVAHLTVAGTDVNGPALGLNVDLPSDWQPFTFGAERGTSSPPSGMAFVVSEVDNTFADPCSHRQQVPKVGPTVEALATALGEVPGTTATKPVPTTIAGYKATYIELAVPASLPCEPSQFYLWQDWP